VRRRARAEQLSLFKTTRSAVDTRGMEGAGTPPFDTDVAASYLGKTILVGVTYLDPEGATIRREQVYGVIEAVSRAGIVVVLRGARAGTVITLPPHLTAIRPAEPGVYSLFATGESVDHPDLLSTWRVRQRATIH